ncbi:MAG: nodulation protein NfeD [Candidatus Eisenbacteria bacterium]|nr:nodulation protein NfeD [Candidatus Eisenbacteria bacterium]
MSRMLSILRIVSMALLASVGVLSIAQGQVGSSPACRAVRWDGPIGPAAADYLEREIRAADRDGIPLLILGLDTPGGLDTSMRRIVREIGASRVPVAVWVGPSGSRAASAGCVIGLSAPILAMAPGTNIGAAHPVPLGGGPVDSVMGSKILQDAEAYIGALARQHGRNETWARDAVRKSVSASAEDAVRLGVADLIASNLPELVAAIDGRTVRIATGSVTLALSGHPIDERRRDWRTSALALLNDPNVAYILLLLGVYGLFFELANPGSLFPGIFGVTSLILGLYALSNLPVNSAGLLLLVAGLAMLLLEIKVVSHGLLSLGGVAALVAGSLFLFESPSPVFRVSLTVIIPAVFLTAAFFLFLVGKGLAAQRRPPATGSSSLVGRLAVARTRLAPRGSVFVDGSHWRAEAPPDVVIDPGQMVRILNVDRLSLNVRPEAEPPTTGELP